MPHTPDIDLRDFDVILLNSSAGKDSMALIDTIAQEAARQDVLDRLVVGHADLGRVEWPGTRTLAQRQAERYGLNVHQRWWALGHIPRRRTLSSRSGPSARRGPRGRSLDRLRQPDRTDTHPLAGWPCGASRSRR